MTKKTLEITSLQEKFMALQPFLTERSIRIWCATEAKAIGPGGWAIVHKATGVSWPTIKKGLQEP